MKKIWIIVFAIVFGLILSLMYLLTRDEGECQNNFDCVAASCCHLNSCVALNQVPNCSGILCTMNCEPETLDCGQGSCKCVDGKCEVNWNE